jgi:hypothetical protein
MKRTKEHHWYLAIQGHLTPFPFNFQATRRAYRKDRTYRRLKRDTSIYWCKDEGCCAMEFRDIDTAQIIGGLRRALRSVGL